jgi:hypothetical protein
MWWLRMSLLTSLLWVGAVAQAASATDTHDTPDESDPYERIVPTPVQPPEGSWQPGDRVEFRRSRADTVFVYTRETTYERTSKGLWAISANRVTRVACDGPCPKAE